MLKLNLIESNGCDLYFCSNTDNNIEILTLSDLPRTADICRLNCLSMIKFAGSGHIGTSFSATEIMTCLKYISKFSTQHLEKFKDAAFFSSKGHDAPMLYCVMHAFGEIADSDLLKLRRFRGLPGHPTIDISGVLTNTGSLGMGISKAKGMVYANRINGVQRKVIVLLGDGELQEGQIWEDLPGAHRDELSELIVIVDANGIQSDSWVAKTLELGDIKSRVTSFGWNFIECDGNSVDGLISALKTVNSANLPTWIHANTKKGRGVSFMEEFPSDGTYYQFHSGAPNASDYELAINEIKEKIGVSNTKENHQGSIAIKNYKNHYIPQILEDSMAFQYSLVLYEVIKNNNKIIALDGDLNKDTGTFLVKNTLPTNYIQCGIAEQDMVSIAGGLALNGIVPIVHSFGTFLTMRGYEQIFNNSTEFKTILYVGFLAGLLPAMPGISHQAVNDFPIMSAIPNMKLFEPASQYEIKKSISKAIKHHGPSYIRMQSVGAIIKHSNNYKELECLTIWEEFETENAIICSGLSILEQALEAGRILEKSGTHCSILTIFDYEFAHDLDTLNYLSRYNKVLVIENYLPGNLLFNILKDNLSFNNENLNITRVGVNEFPKCGQNNEILQYYKMDAKNIVTTFLDSSTWT
jgi:transketolase